MDEIEHIAAKKSLGQHFLTNPHVSEAMAEAGKVRKGDHVLEVGPGTGALTKVLLARGARVTAIEADSRAVESLQRTFSEEVKSGQLTLFHKDIRETSLEELGLSTGSYKAVANIPYYISGMLFRTFLAGGCQPTTLVFLVQKEVAVRIARAGNGEIKESLLSLSVKAYGEPRYVQTIAKGNFNPVPKVDSAILAVENVTKERFKTLDESFFFELLHLGLGSKRKQLLGSLTKRFDREALERIFDTLSLSKDVRGEDLPIDTWVTLAQELHHL